MTYRSLVPNYILDADHRVVAEPDLYAWARWFEDHNKRIVAQGHIGKYLVSTVFLGIDHRFGGEGPPLLFETMIFDQNHEEVERDDFDYTMRRYSSWDDAETGHKATVNMVRKALKR